MVPVGGEGGGAVAAALLQEVVGQEAVEEGGEEAHPKPQAQALEGHGVEEAGQGLLGDPEGGQDHQHPFQDGGNVLGLGVAEGVVLVRRLAGDPEGGEGGEGRGHVHQGLEGVREQGHRAREKVGEGLEPQHEEGDGEAQPGGAFGHLDPFFHRLLLGLEEGEEEDVP